MNLFNRRRRTLLAAVALVVSIFSSGAFAQDADTGMDTAYVPFLVNVDAVVKAQPEDGAASAAAPVQISVRGGEESLMRIPVQKTISVLYGAQKQANRSAVVSSRGGKIIISLPAQSYKNAEIAIYGANGKRIIHQKASASNAVSNISRRNLAAGTYILSVKGTGGDAITSRLTHSGGGMDIKVAIGCENRSSAEKLTKKAAAESWTITVSAVWHVDSSYTFSPNAGMNAAQTITLREAPDDGTFTDERDGRTYRTVKIGNQTWMAENLNHQTLNISRCYNGSADNCVKYGRLYDWATAKRVCPAGWRLPDTADWNRLVNAVGGASVAGNMLKSTIGWRGALAAYKLNKNGADDFGFSALPGGYWGNDSNFEGGGDYGCWWTATEYNSDNACLRCMYSSSDGVKDDNFRKSLGYSVRCIQDKN
jgi:uncharacterized protein (TIGR02145 family)